MSGGLLFLGNRSLAGIRDIHGATGLEDDYLLLSVSKYMTEHEPDYEDRYRNSQ